MTVRTVPDFRELKQIVERPYPILKINTTMQKLRLHLCNGITPDHLNSGRDVYHLFPMGHQRNEWFDRHLPSRNDGPNEALVYVQAYIDNLTVITRGTQEDNLV